MIIHTSYTQGKDTQRRAVLTYKVGKARMAPLPCMQVAFPSPPGGGGGGGGGGEFVSQTEQQKRAARPCVISPEYI